MSIGPLKSARKLAALRILFAAGIVACSAPVSAPLCAQSSQWSGVSPGPIYYNGNVGIGTAAPEEKLSVIGGNLMVDSFSLTPGTPKGLFFRSGFGSATGNKYSLSLLADDVGLGRQGGFSINAYDGIRFVTGTNDSSGERMRILIGGNVGIGTTAPQYKLAVNGTIGAKDVIVTNTGWSDYVFRPGYRLRPLSEVGAYIRAHHRLPGIPSEAEVKEKGVSVGEMQAKLLAKVEELTLHMIQQDKDNRELREHLSRQEKQNQELRERIAQLESRAARTAHAAGR